MSFVLSPLALNRLDELKAKHHARTRGEFMRAVMEWFLGRQNTSPAVMLEIEKHHDQLNGTGLRHRNAGPKPAPLRRLGTVRASADEVSSSESSPS